MIKGKADLAQTPAVGVANLWAWLTCVLLHLFPPETRLHLGAIHLIYSID